MSSPICIKPDMVSGFMDLPVFEKQTVDSEADTVHDFIQSKNTETADEERCQTMGIVVKEEVIDEPTNTPRLEIATLECHSSLQRIGKDTVEEFEKVTGHVSSADSNHSETKKSTANLFIKPCGIIVNSHNVTPPAMQVRANNEPNCDVSKINNNLNASLSNQTETVSLQHITDWIAKSKNFAFKQGFSASEIKAILEVEEIFIKKQRELICTMIEKEKV
jgi:hypothetical protein